MNVYGFLKIVTELWFKKNGFDVKLTPNSNTYTATTTFSLPPLTSGSSVFVGDTTTQTLTNKTLTAPVISTIVNTGTLTLPTSTDTLVGRATTDALTNKDFDGGTASNTSRITVPKNTTANLTALTRKQATILYDTSLNKLFVDNGSTLDPVGSGSGSGKNYIPQAAQNTANGWTASAGGISVSTETTSSNFPDNITQTSAVKILRASASDYAYVRWTQDAADYNKLHGILFDFKYAGTAGDYTLQLLTNTASNYAGTYTTVTLPTTSIPSTGTGSSSFQTSGLSGGSGTQFMELRINGIAGTTPLYLNNVTFTPNAPAQGAAVSDWTSYVPVASGFTASSIAGFYRRVGDTVHVKVRAVVNTVSGTLTITAPPLTLNTAVLPGGVSTGLYGSAAFYDASANNGFTGTPFFATSTTIGFYGPNSVNWSNTVPVAGAAGDFITFELFYPASEWAGNGTVNLGPGAQVEYSSDDGTNDVFGPNGSLVPNVAFGTGTTTRVFSFQYPQQTTQVMNIELNNGGNGFANASDFYPFSGGNNTNVNNFYGIRGFWSSSTQFTVEFGNQGTRVNTSNADNGASSWATRFAAGDRFRVSKASPSAPVGFGLAGTDGTAGLYKPGQAPGQVTGATIAAGYIGQEITATESSVALTAGTFKTSANTLILTAGNWVVYHYAYFVGVASLTGVVAGLSTDAGATTFSDASSASNPGNANNGRAVASSAVDSTITFTKTFNISATTTYYPKAICTGANTTYGFFIKAVRIA